MADTNKDLCVICSKEVKQTDCGIECDKCGNWLHIKCAGIKKELYDAINKNNSKYILCLCNKCRIFRPYVDGDPNAAVQDVNSAVDKRLSEHINKIMEFTEGKLQNMEKKIFSVLSDMNKSLNVGIGTTNATGLPPPNAISGSSKSANISRSDSTSKTKSGPQTKDLSNTKSISEILSNAENDWLANVNSQEDDNWEQVPARKSYAKTVGSRPSGSQTNYGTNRSKETATKSNSTSQPSRTKTRAKKTVTLGSSEGGKLKTAPRGMSIKRLFISRLHPDTTEQDVIEEIKDTTGTDVEVIKLRTKSDSYASFCVVTTYDNYEKVANPCYWGRNIILAPFYGVPAVDKANLTSEKR